MGIAFSLAQAFCWAAASIALRPLSDRLDVFVVNGIRAGLALLVIIPLIWLTNGFADYRLLSYARLTYLLGSVIVGGVVADAPYILSVRFLGVSRAFPITSSYPLFAVLFGWLL